MATALSMDCVKHRTSAALAVHDIVTCRQLVIDWTLIKLVPFSTVGHLLLKSAT